MHATNVFIITDRYNRIDTILMGVIIEYRIMQIVRGGKVSWLYDLVIRGKAFTIIPAIRNTL